MPLDVLPRTIGLLTSSLDADYSRRLVAGCAQVLTENGYCPLCFSPGASSTTEYEVPLGFLELVQPKQLAGVIFSPPSMQFVEAPSRRAGATEADQAATPSYDLDHFLRTMGELPTVCVGAGIEGVPGVWVQNGAGIRMLMKHLTECGRRRIAFVCGPQQNVEAKSRFRAWEDYCIERSLPHGEELVATGDFTPTSGEAAAIRILKKNDTDLPDAIVVSNDRMAIGVLRALRTAGLRVPDDVSVVGFDDLEADSTDPPLTTIRQPVFEMGHRAAEVLIAMLNKEPVSTEHMFVPKLVVRASSRPGYRRLSGDSARLVGGNSVFLESAYPSEKMLIPAIRGRLAGAHRRTESKTIEGETPAELETDLERAKARERDLVAGVRSMRVQAVGHLEQVLGNARCLPDVHAAVLTYLRFIGMQSLIVALRVQNANAPDRYRLVVAVDVATDEPLRKLDTQLAGINVMAVQAQTTPGFLRVAQPLYCQGHYCGVLVASGILVDNPLLIQLGSVLVGALKRIVN
jgi:DNA-binding LacI/PurR family transcriptional regulator